MADVRQYNSPLFGLNIDPAQKNLQEEQQQATLFAEEIVPGVREQLRSS